MSFCLRSIPSKFTSLINTHRQISKLNHPLSEHVKSSLFLKEFLGMQTKMNVAVSSSRSSVNSLISLLEQNIPLTFFNNCIEKTKISNKKYNCNKQQILTLRQQKRINVRALNATNSDPSIKCILKSNTKGIESCMDSENRKYNLSPTEIPSNKRIFDNTLSTSKMEGILYSNVSPNIKNINEKQPQDQKSPKEHLSHVFECLRRDLPLMFVRRMDYSIYTPDLIFINNIKGTTTTGIQHYANVISLLKIVGHFKYAYVKCNILKITMHPEDNSVKARWRIEGVSGSKVLFSFWKFRLWNLKEQVSDNEPTWYDGFSTFYVNNDGKIYKHVVDKLMPDQEQEKLKTSIEPKLALFTALFSWNSYYFNKFYLKIHSYLLQIK